MTDRIVTTISQELGASAHQVNAAIALLDEGATVPFIARYRKELTGALDDTQLRTLEQRLGYLRELEERRATVLNSIQEQGKLTDELAQAIASADTRTRLEDLYLPFKPKRKTRGLAAIEAGLLPLADRLLADPLLDPQIEAAAYLAPDQGITDVAGALEGARYILMERFAEDAELLGKLRDYLWQHGKLASAVVAEKKAEAARFQDYFDHSEPLQGVPSHRALAMLRGRREGMINLALTCGDEAAENHPCEHMVANIGRSSAVAGRRMTGSPAWCAGPGASSCTTTSKPAC